MINKLAVLFFKLFLYPLVYLKRRRRDNPCNQVKNFLFVNTTGIGDTILSTPAWRVLRNRFPGARITLLVHKKRFEVAENNPLVDNIIVYRKFTYFFRLIKEFRKFKIDTAVIFHGNDPDILPLVFLGGAEKIIGYKKRTRLPYFLTTALPELPGHFIRAQMELAEEAAGNGRTVIREYPPEKLRPCFFLIKNEREGADVFLDENSLKGKTLIGLLPGAGRLYKRWPVERFAGAAGRFLKNPDNAVIILGSKKESPLARKIENLCGRKNNLILAAGSFNLRQSSALMERLHLFITNDSGPLHIAIALGVPTVALFCPSDPSGLLAPGEDRQLKIIKKDIPCKPCITKRCRRPFCMDRISVEEVIKVSGELNANLTQ
jgi:lipopolysaccharide heptosyltransferase II